METTPTPVTTEDSAGQSAALSSRGERLSQSLAEDQAAREALRRRLAGKLARASFLGQLGRYACVAAGFIGPWAVAPQPPYLDWVKLPVFYTLVTLWIGGPGMLIAGMVAQRALLGLARREAIEVTPPAEFDTPDSLPNDKLRELRAELEAIGNRAGEAERVCVGCALFGAALVAARLLGVYWEDSSSGWMLMLLLGPMVVIADLAAAIARISVWWSFRSLVRQVTAAENSTARATPQPLD